MALKILGDDERLLPMTAVPYGYFEVIAEDVSPGTRYLYQLDRELDRPDPASRFQPDGVHRASAIVDPHFDWEDGNWHGLPLHQFITYEVHVGTFSSDGTFDGVTEQLDQLVELGITAVELMPVAQFPGGRNWGYDGVHPFAVQNTYGGPEGLRRLVNACHLRGLAVVMDVVYNHLGPEGNYLSNFGHYFTDRYRTPWGQAVNFDDRDGDEVRRFFIENALYWIDEFHIDALRLDAVHAIYDFSARPFLQELGEAVRIEGRRLNRQVFTIAESSLNDGRLIRPVERGGIGIDAQWCDDLHHSLRTALTDERTG
ncbi:MAG: malto-oligosyltrehalose trehalohydrolase, partial [Planctomycetes bacterium]|nr:malto-oligosyltrehalose trehalohydrolase [Planctomycetota bacterium]